jgi:hypothetical protein
LPEHVGLKRKQIGHWGVAQNRQSKFGLQPKLIAPTYRALTNKLGLGELPKMAVQSLASNQNWLP